MSQRIRILHVRVDLVFGGTEKVILEHLTRIDPNRFDTTLVCLKVEGPLTRKARELGIPVEVIEMSSRFDLSASRRLSEIARERHIDLIVTYGVRADLIGSKAARNLKKPWISRVPNLMYNDYSNPIQGQLFYWLDRWLLRKADAVILCAKFPEEKLRRGLFALKDLVYIPNGIDLEETDVGEDISGLKQSLGLSEKERIILCAGRLESIKGQRYLIEAMPWILKDHPDAVLLLAGEGSLQRSLERAVDEMGITSSVKFLGFREDVSRLMRLASVYVSPSLHEGMPLAVMEAVALGIPVVATRVGGQPEILSQWGDALLVRSRDPGELGEKISAVLNDLPRYGEIAVKGREWLRENYSWDRAIAQLEALYTRVALGKTSAEG